MLTVCFDAMGTCFSFQPLVDAVEEQFGDQLKQRGQGARMVVMDWASLSQWDEPAGR